MTTLSHIADQLAQFVGVSPTRTHQIARRLREAGMLPAGGPGRAPELDRNDAMTLFVGVATGAKLDDVVEATRATLATTPGGADMSAAPPTIPRTAEIALAVFAGQAADGDDLDGLIIEIAHGETEVAFIWSDGITQRLQSPGAISNLIPKGRVATRIPGPAFAQFVRSIA